MADDKDRDRGEEQQLVVFELAGESYGVEISRVQEIDRIQQITVVPRVAEYVNGVINLRGRITPVVDLCTRLGLPKSPVTPRTRVVVVKSGDEWVGLVVDAVSEVLRIREEVSEQPSGLIADADTAFMRGIAKVEDRLIMLLDLDRILDKEFHPASAVVV